MQAQRRRRYLAAMGVRLWRPRVAAVGTEPPVAELGQEEVALGPGGRPEPPDDQVLPIAEMDWVALRSAVAACQACALHETRTQTVFGVGDPNADLMVIGEAPGAEEDRQGEPFVGRAGQLLDLMLAAIGLKREQVYIANILKCRPPGNRDPRPEEAACCEPFLRRQMALVQPRVLLAVGRIAAQHLLHTDAPIGRLRGRWLALGPESIPLMVTYHPAYLLRSPEEKAKAWRDLQQVALRLGGEGWRPPASPAQGFGDD